MLQVFPKTQVIPSVLSSDFGCLSSEAQRAERAGAQALHLDVMDGLFVPNFGLCPQGVAAINRSTDIFLDVHLMIYNPFDYVERFVESGADQITFHFEATEDVEATIDFIKKLNIKVGLAFSPTTSSELIDRFIPLVDTILIMTVNPGFGGQLFESSMLEKIERTRTLAKKLKLPLNIEVDGGINLGTIKSCYHAGANLFVAGTSIYRASDMKQAIDELSKAIGR